MRWTDTFSVVTHPTWTLLPTAFILSFPSLSLTPSFLSLIALLTSLRLFAQGTLNQFGPIALPEGSPNRNHPVFKALLLWLTLTASISISHLAPSVHALSTPSTSILSLVLLAGLSSAVALVPVYLCNHPKFSVYPQTIVFPSLWATTWLLVSRISPIGRLITWTPLSGIGSYSWITQYLGFAGLDWITAAWASVAAEILGSIILPPQQETTLLVDDDTVESEFRRPELKLPPMTGFLLALVVPSLFTSTLPLPPVSASTTPLRVACILPEASEESQLERFIKETRSYANSAKVLLWPESAVTFETDSDKQLALKQVHDITSTSKVWIGVSFEERVSATGSSRDGQRRNGMTLVGPEGVEMTYYKRKLVPIAESFSQIASDVAPPVHNINLPRPANWPKKDWGPSDTRAIPLSASICLDFSVPLTSLDSRPALVLAPAKTWHTSVGRAMYELAQARGREIGADVLWCDGGKGGLSGVAGDVQVGTGSWIKVIGVPYPFAENQSRTLYGTAGDWLALASVLGIPAVILATQHNMKQIEQQRDSVIAWIRERTQRLTGRIRGENSVHLLDD